MIFIGITLNVKEAHRSVKSPVMKIKDRPKLPSSSGPTRS